VTIATIITTLISICGTIAGVFIGNRLSSSRSYKEKVWDLRRVAYGVILSELAGILRVYDAGDQYLEQSNFHQYTGSKVYDAHNSKINSHFRSKYERMSDDYLILSGEFISLYNEYSKESRGDPYNDDPPTEYERSSKAIRKYHPLLSTLARSEIAK
jgi:hypothetical protein